MSDPEGDRDRRRRHGRGRRQADGGRSGPASRRSWPSGSASAGKARLSLSQVGKVLAVSKERVRQIQDRALEKLRAAAAEEHDSDDALAGVA